MMAEHKDFFLPEQVDEQIDQLFQGGILSSRDQRLTQALQTLLREKEDQQSLHLVLTQLQNKRNAGAQEGENSVSLPQRRRKGVSGALSQETTPFQRKPDPLSRGLSLLAACLVLVIVVGSLFLVLNEARQKKNISSASQSTKAVQPSPTETEPLGKIVYISGNYDMAFGLQWSPDGQRLAGVLNRTTLVSWDAKTGKQKLMYATPGETLLGYVAWSPDGNFLVVQSN